MTLGSFSPLSAHALANGAPRHFHVVCADACGFRGQRTGDDAEAIVKGRPCPRCGAAVKPVTT